MTAIPCYDPVECPFCDVDVMPIVDEDGAANCPVCGTDVLTAA